MSAPGRGLSLFLAVIFFGASAGWFWFEYYATRGFITGSSSYDWAIESLSDLGVPYRQVHPLSHKPVLSVRAKSLNFIFQANGILFALGQLGLLFSSRATSSTQATTSRTVRMFLSILIACGMILLSLIHGGPREQAVGTIGWHWIGLALVAVAGSLNSLVAGLVAGQVNLLDRSLAYRTLSILLGVAGLFSFYRFHTLGTWDYQTHVGLWQRGVIYPLQAWQAMTAIGLLAAVASSGSPQASKAKRS